MLAFAKAAGYALTPDDLAALEIDLRSMVDVGRRIRELELDGFDPGLDPQSPFSWIRRQRLRLDG